MHFIQRQIINIQLTSIKRFSEIISMWIRNEIFRFGFFGSIIKLTHMRGNHKIEALATIICVTARQTVKAKIGQPCFIDVSLQHPSADGTFRRALLTHNFLSNMTNRHNNPEQEKCSHFLTMVTRYLKESWNYTMSCVVVCWEFFPSLHFFSFLTISLWLASVRRVVDARGRSHCIREP